MKAGLQPGDVITSFNGQSVIAMGDAEFVKLVRALSVGTKVPVEYLRNKEKKSTEITIEAMP
jgi:S1-C subfamily serine protease